MSSAPAPFSHKHTHTHFHLVFRKGLDTAVILVAAHTCMHSHTHTHSHLSSPPVSKRNKYLKERETRRSVVTQHIKKLLRANDSDFADGLSQ